ncbi:MAG: aminoacyl-tRNA deacylase [Anaerolineae bacterium]
MAELARSASKVQEALRDAGVDVTVLQLDSSTRTAELAAKAVGAPVGTIAKSLVCVADGKPLLALVAGDRRADMGKIAAAVGAREARLSTAIEARDITGYAVGGVPPVGHKDPLPVLVDESLSRFEIVYGAAGTPHAVFAIRFADLVRITGGRRVDIVEPAG